MNSRPNADEIVRMLHLEPLEVEGGLFASTYRSAAMNGEKNAGTAIYYFLQGGAFSHMHRLPTDEVYHFYLGDPVELLQLLPDGTGRAVLLGNNLAAGQRPQHVVPAGSWHGSHLLPGGQYALLGTTMAPGFAPGDYEHADAAALRGEYPAFSGLIDTLTGPVRYR